MGERDDLYGLRNNGAEFPVEISLSPIETAEGVLISSAIRDVSERKRLQQELGEKNTRLENADKAKDLFLAVMSHELRTPLQVIMGFADLLAEEVEGPLTGKQKLSIGYVLDGSKHLLKLVNDILDLSKIQADGFCLRREFFDTSEAIKEMATSVQLQVKAKSINLETSNNGCQMLHADRLRFRQILSNLLGNAIKFTPVGGTISIDATRTNSFIEIAVSGVPRKNKKRYSMSIIRLARQPRVRSLERDWVFPSHARWWSTMAGASGWRVSVGREAGSLSLFHPRKLTGNTPNVAPWHRN